MSDNQEYNKFLRLVQQGCTRIPVARSLFADLDTPVGTYLKLGNSPYTYLLESVQGGEKWGRYSFIGLPAKRIIKAEGFTLTEYTRESDGDEFTRHSFECEDPLDYIQRQIKNSELDPALKESSLLTELPRFCGGFVGYFSYDAAGYSEKRLRHLLDKEDPLSCPQILIMQSDEIIAFDNLLGKMILICYADLSSGEEKKAEGKGEENNSKISETAGKEAYAKTQKRLDEIEQILAKPMREGLNSPLKIHGSDSDANLHKLLSTDEAGTKYRANVTRIKKYVHAGDVMQVVPSQRMSINYPHKDFDFYRALRTVNPAPYMFFLDLDDFRVAGASPEILARLEHDGGKRIATIRPIAGTRPRGKDEAEDLRLEKDMLQDPKEIAEHLMLIDLGRNDIGKVSKIGTVKLSDEFQVERYSHVMHIVSNVVGELKEELDAMDLLRASLPAGTLSGAPKIRAMEIIAELEEYKRGIYGGALGYIGWDGNMDMCIAIRTALIKDGKLFLQAGGGIVADSDEDKEWQETLNKRGALLRVASMLGLETD